MNFTKLFKAGFLGNCLAVLAGAMLTLAFAPFSQFYFAIISPALLLGLWLNVTPKNAFWRGYLYGIGLFTSGVYWVFISIHTYGNASIWLAGLITAFFIAILAFFPAMNGFFLTRLFPHNTRKKIIYGFAATWVLLEWIRSLILTGFPWLLIGNSQVNSPLKGYAPILGVYGVSLLVILTSGLLVDAILNFHKKERRPAYISLSLIIAIWLLGWGLTFITWVQPYGKPIQVSLVQGNIPQDLKWSEDALLPTLKEYERLTAANWKSKLIIWPEDAIPLPLQNARDFVNDIDQQAKRNGSTLITGIPIKHATKDVFYNAVIAIGNSNDFYLKHRLVPFGEYTPLPKIFNEIMQKFDIPMSDLIEGEDAIKPLLANGLRIATFVCYEVAYPELVLFRESNVNLLLTVSNDAWFGRSIAQAQHLEIARMRSIELARPMLFVSNTGITAIIKPDGEIQSSAPPYQTYVLTDTVQPVQGLTFWQKHAMDPLLLMIAFFLFESLRSQRKHHK